MTLPQHVLARLERMSVKGAAMPFLRKGKPGDGFKQLRAAVIAGAGFDFLETVGDMMRPQNLTSSKPGVAARSRHKLGDAFDYNQADPRYVIVPEIIESQQYWATWLRCTDQKSPSPAAERVRLVSDVMGRVEGFYFNFTACAARFGYLRIPAWKGWSHKGPKSTMREFWHYQCTEGLTFDEAIRYLYGPPDILRPQREALNDRILGLNDRGVEVRNLQVQLRTLGLLDPEEVDGVFGEKTYRAVLLFQKDQGLARDGKVGPQTRRKLVEMVIAATQH
jgi:hypothetical protein